MMGFPPGRWAEHPPVMGLGVARSGCSSLSDEEIGVWLPAVTPLRWRRRTFADLTALQRCPGSRDVRVLRFPHWAIGVSLAVLVGMIL